MDKVVNLHKLALKHVGAYAECGLWDEDLKDIEGVYLNGEGEFLITVLDGKIVGMGAFRKKDEKTAEIKRMRVLPDHQRQQIGTLILQKLEEEAKRLGYHKLILDTTMVQTAAQLFYLKNGYKEVGKGKTGRYDCIFFEKNIQS